VVEWSRGSCIRTNVSSTKKASKRSAVITADSERTRKVALTKATWMGRWKMLRKSAWLGGLCEWIGWSYMADVRRTEDMSR